MLMKITIFQRSGILNTLKISSNDGELLTSWLLDLLSYFVTITVSFSGLIKSKTSNNTIENTEPIQKIK